MSESLIKLTDADGYTRRGETGETLWTPGEWVEVEWGAGLCKPGCLHAYRSPYIAAFSDPNHANLLPLGIAWRAEGAVRANDGTKVGCSRLRVIKRIKLPELSATARVRAAVMVVYPIASYAWREWADEWLKGDRTAGAAWAEADAAARAAEAALMVARAAARAAEADAAAARASEVAAKADAADAAAWAAWAVNVVARAAAGIDLDAIIREAAEAEEGENE
jgi:hypothetical protein